MVVCFGQTGTRLFTHTHTHTGMHTHTHTSTHTQHIATQHIATQHTHTHTTHSYTAHSYTTHSYTTHAHTQHTHTHNTHTLSRRLEHAFRSLCTHIRQCTTIRTKWLCFSFSCLENQAFFIHSAMQNTGFCESSRSLFSLRVESNMYLFPIPQSFFWPLFRTQQTRRQIFCTSPTTGEKDQRHRFLKSNSIPLILPTWVFSLSLTLGGILVQVRSKNSLLSSLQRQGKFPQWKFSSLISGRSISGTFGSQIGNAILKLWSHFVLLFDP